MFKDLFEKRTP